MIKLEKYLEENPQEESVIANIFNRTGCYDYIDSDSDYDWKLDKTIYTYTLKMELLKWESFYLLKEEDSYLIFSIRENTYKNKNWIYEKTRENIQNVKKVILVESIYSFTKNKKLATKNIQRLQKIAENLKAKILVDTYTPQLVHLVQKMSLNIMKESSLHKENWVAP